MKDLENKKDLKDLKKILLLGSGGLKISQAGEFDYSGSQAIKALKEEGIKVILVNPNIATIQTDQDMADEVYLQPLTLESLTKIIEKETPDGILLGFGGQTALNLGLALEEAGVLEKHKVKVLGTSTKSIRLSEDRKLFKDELDKINIKTAKSFAITNIPDALSAAEEVGYPLMMRSGFSLGGLGSGIIYSPDVLKIRVQEALSSAPQVLIEENLIGWSEFEYEIVRDCAGNVLTVCNMENLDPMGIHTGESIVVSPSQSLNNHEYHFLREVALKVANHFEIIGECNIQYAVNLKDFDYRVIEINPRLSRSSALASKATGYPLAFIAAKLSLGFKLFDLKNSVTKKTCAYFEPALDYVVVKIPRWDIQKLKGAGRRIGTEMKSVGEVMAIGRSFSEALQKAIGMLNIGASGLTDYPYEIKDPEDEIKYATDRRIFALYHFLKSGKSIQEARDLSGIDLWFLNQIKNIVDLENKLECRGGPACPPLIDLDLLRELKKSGFSDRAIAKSLNSLNKNNKNLTELDIRKLRLENKITPVIKQIDTLAGEFDAQTNYLYLTYHGEYHDVKPSETPIVLILGSGPYSIGSSVEFDWCAVTTARQMRKKGQSVAIINSNPETVSTDYDESDRLYFEQLTLERVSDIAEFENLAGIVVSVGGQVANNLVNNLNQMGFKIFGTAPEDIHKAEDRSIFSAMLNNLNIDQPDWVKANSFESALEFANKIGYPVLIRPSYVLSGSAMNVVRSEEELEIYLKEAVKLSPDHPVVISEFITDAKELEIDGVAENGDICLYVISEHIENAGVHSGDATIVLPPQKLYLETIRRAKQISKKIVRALNISGPFNLQLIAKDNDLKVIECNVRASRSFPFVSKVTGINFIEVATQVLLGCYVKKQYNTLDLDYVGVKAPQFSYSRLKGANPVAHVEMASTGEVACLGDNLDEAFYLAMMASDIFIKNKKAFISIGDEKKSKLLPYLKILADQGWEFICTYGTHHFLKENGIDSACVFKAREEGKTPNTSSIITQREVGLIINIPRGNASSTHETDGFLIRRLAIDHHIPLVTNVQIAQQLLISLSKLYDRPLIARSLREITE